MISAPIWKRALSHYVDLLIISIPACIYINLIYGAIGPAEEHRRILAWYGGIAEPFLYLWFSFVFFYFVLSEAGWGATIGKYIFGLRVVKVDGDSCGFKASFTRNILRAVDGLFGYLVGLLFILTSPVRQRLGDLLAGTVVIERTK